MSGTSEKNPLIEEKPGYTIHSGSQLKHIDHCSKYPVECSGQCTPQNYNHRKQIKKINLHAASVLAVTK